VEQPPPFRRVMYIIIKGKSSFKGKNVSEFQDNLIKAGYPPEMNEKERDKVRFFEQKKGRPIKRSDLREIDSL
jgi:hypothetical protein